MIAKVLEWFKWKFFHLLIRLGLRKDETPKDYYISKISSKAPWVYCSYIVSSLNQKQKVTDSHQSLQESIEMVNIWNKLGYNVYVQEYTSNNKLPNIDVRLVFGHEPNMVRASRKYPHALKIYYATGAYSKHQNKQVKFMTDIVNRRYNAQIPYRRLVQCNDEDNTIEKAYEIADRILLIGSKFTLQTFPINLRDKIDIINQSSQLNTRDISCNYAKENEFFFMGSYGNMLRGLPLLIDYFTKHINCILHIVGPIEDDYYSCIKTELTDNIILHGFMNINSDDFKSIIYRCNFLVYPSGSEGSPGSVLNSMKYGLVPIVTSWAAFDEIEQYGYLMKDWTLKSLENGIDWALSLNMVEIETLKKKCCEYVNQKYTLELYKEQFYHYFENQACVK